MVKHLERQILHKALTFTTEIRGESVAASCCASLLEKANVPFVRLKVGKSKLPAIMVSSSTQRLIGDIFPAADLFAGLLQIRQRVVQWNAASPAVAVPHAAIVISEETFLQRLSAAQPARALEEDPLPRQEPDWRILSARPLPPISQEIQFGSRIATACKATLKSTALQATSWVEALPNGWLFLVPSDPNAWLLSVGGPAQSLLAESSLIAPQLASVAADGPQFPCHPRIADPLCGNGWLACGSAALGFDPLCGDGSGYAAREAILAAAIVRALREGGSAHDLLRHYRARLVAGLHRHVEVCAEFYRSGPNGPWWQEQVEATEQGLRWCQAAIVDAGPFRYRLNGFSLEALAG